MKTVIWNDYLKCDQVVNYTDWSMYGNTKTGLWPIIKERTYYGIKIDDIYIWWKSRKTAIKYAYLFHKQLYEKTQKIDNVFYVFAIHLNPWVLYKK